MKTYKEVLAESDSEDELVPEKVRTSINDTNKDVKRFQTATASGSGTNTNGGNRGGRPFPAGQPSTAAGGGGHNNTLPARAGSTRGRNQHPGSRPRGELGSLTHTIINGSCLYTFAEGIAFMGGGRVLSL